jgi:predicted ATP-dependent serine protease
MFFLIIKSHAKYLAARGTSVLITDDRNIGKNTLLLTINNRISRWLQALTP